MIPPIKPASILWAALGVSAALPLFGGVDDGDAYGGEETGADGEYLATNDEKAGLTPLGAAPDGAPETPAGTPVGAAVGAPEGTPDGTSVGTSPSVAVEVDLISVVASLGVSSCRAARLAKAVVERIAIATKRRMNFVNLAISFDYYSLLFNLLLKSQYFFK
jgi:hypothetical protein